MESQAGVIKTGVMYDDPHRHPLGGLHSGQIAACNYFPELRTSIHVTRWFASTPLETPPTIDIVESKG